MIYRNTLGQAREELETQELCDISSEHSFRTNPLQLTPHFGVSEDQEATVLRRTPGESSISCVVNVPQSQGDITALTVLL